MYLKVGDVAVRFSNKVQYIILVSLSGSNGPGEYMLLSTDHEHDSWRSRANPRCFDFDLRDFSKGAERAEEKPGERLKEHGIRENKLRK